MLKDTNAEKLANAEATGPLLQPTVMSAIIGASRPEQLTANLEALNVELDDELLAVCDSLWY